MDWRKKLLLDVNIGKTQLVSSDCSNYTDVIDVKMDGSIHEEKSPFKMMGLTFSSILYWGSYVISIVKNAYKRIGVLIRSMKFLSLEVALYLYKSTIRQALTNCIRAYVTNSKS